MNQLDIMRIFVPAMITFLIGIGITPFVTYFLYKWKMWKPKAGKVAFDGKPAEVFNQLHQARETGTPRFGGIIVWGSVILCALFISVLALLFPEDFGELAFISRGQTWIPFAALVAGAFVGFFDDLFEVRGTGGLKLRVRLLIVAFIAALCAIWFYEKLDVSSISFPFLSIPLDLGVWFMLFFVLTALFMYAGGVIDGIDGLAGGIFCAMFAAYAGIAFFQHQFDIAALGGAIAGGLLAFLWFNIPPARFYLSETGTMGLTLALVVIAFMTDMHGGGKGISVLPIIALPLVVTVASIILQLVWKKAFKKKLLRIAPLH
ncbi:hypothetical protein K2Q08_01585, partial [Patescibacteria group bacterium]|nr:hypothetical protein [Patescibacteria group bacterium]